MTGGKLWRLLLSFALFLLPLSASALSQTAVLTVGGAFAPAQTASNTDGSTTTIGPLAGPHVQVGFELGEHWTSRFSVIFSAASGPASVSTQPDVSASAALQLLGGGYQLTYDVLGKGGGVSPYFGAGLWAGQAAFHVEASERGFSAFKDGNATLLEFHAVGGVRYTLSSGLGFCVEVVYSTYGGFLGTVIPQVGVTYHLG